jgi:hypothetical protein
VRPPKPIHIRLAASVFVALMLATIAPLAARGASPSMRQAKAYRWASSVSAFTVGPGVVGFESDGQGFWNNPIREPVSFRVPKGTRSVKVSIVDESGVDVLAFVQGDVADRLGRHPVCDVPQTVVLARGARVIEVFPDAGHYGHFWDTGFAGDGGPCFLPLSFPTTGTITVVFSKS